MEFSILILFHENTNAVMCVSTHHLLIKVQKVNCSDENIYVAGFCTTISVVASHSSGFCSLLSNCEVYFDFGFTVVRVVGEKKTPTTA